MSKKTGLMNENGMFSVIRRLYTGDFGETVGELIQNAQRAGASRFEIVSTLGGGDQGSIEFRDNGRGLSRMDDENPVEGFRKFLAIGESGFDEQVMRNQNPMGVGFYSLLCQPGVNQITITSGGFSLTVDAARWCSDPEYREDWRDSVKTAEAGDFGKGVSVQATVESALVHRVEKMFAGQNHPATGYEDLLEVVLNSQKLDCAFHNRMDSRNVLIETTFEGNQLRIGCAGRSDGPWLVVNWYGQIVEKSTEGFDVELVVRHGQPVTPMSPSRRGLVEDEKLAELFVLVRNEIDRFFSDSANVARMTPGILARAFRSYPGLAEQSKFIVAEKLKPELIENRSTEGRDSDFVILEKESRPLALLQGVAVEMDGENTVEMSGMESFLETIEEIHGPSYRLVAGVYPSLSLTWKPGVACDLPGGTGIRQFQPGVFGLSEEGEPQEWHELSGKRVWAFESTTSWDIEYCNLMIGAEGGSESVVSVIESVSDLLFDWNWDCDDSADTCRDAYENSVESVIRRILGGLIRLEFTHRDLLDVTPKDRTIRSVNFIKREDRMKPMTVWDKLYETKGVELVFDDGSTATFGLR